MNALFPIEEEDTRVEDLRRVEGGLERFKLTLCHGCGELKWRGGDVPFIEEVLELS